MRELILYKNTLHASFGSLITSIIIKPKSETIMLTVESYNLKMLMMYLKKFSMFDYKCLMDILIVDYPARNKRFEVVYTLISIKYMRRLLIKTHASDKELMQSMSSLFKSAG